jgi:hypothetical protein
MRTSWLFLPLSLLMSPFAFGQTHEAATTAHPLHRVPIIDVTDLYHPHEDVGDNFDLITAYALPDVDLKAVILDAHDSFRTAISHHPILKDSDKDGPRDPGFIPVLQLNYIFNRNVPFGVGPFNMMKSPDDKMLDAPGFQQSGVELILKTLRESREKICVLSFGSARPLAVAFNRAPELFRQKVERIYLSAGSSEPSYLEWNVALDPNAAVRLLRSGLPIDVFPCATGQGPFAYGEHNSYWKLLDLAFIQRMDPKLRRYLNYAFGRVARSDFLCAMDADSEPNVEAVRAYSQPHNVWETAIWMAAANRRLVKRSDGTSRIMPAGAVLSTDTVLPNELQPCNLDVHDDGRYAFHLISGASRVRMYSRGDPAANEAALREALPALYLSFK